MTERVLVIDDDLTTTKGLRRLLEQHGYDVLEINDSAKALEAARRFQPQSVILDYMMPCLHGGDVAWQLASDPQLRHSKVIICSGVEEQEIFRRLPPVRIPILGKPIDIAELLGLLRSQ